MVALNAAALAVAAALAAQPHGAAPDVSLLDLIETEIGYTTIGEQYYRSVPAQTLLDGARTGLQAYLRARGIAQPQVGAMHARADGRGAVPAIEQQIGRIIVRYGRRVDVRELVYAAIRGEVGALHDPYSVFFTKAELQKFSVALNGETFGGIGVALSGDEKREHWRAADVFPDSPAARAGVHAGDEMVAIDGEPVAGRTTQELSALLRGKVGSVVHVSIARDGAPLPEALAIVRAPIAPPEVTSRMLPGATGYVALRTFGPTAGAEVHAALRRLREQGAHAFVFDLRGNGGGYESAAVAVASAFVPNGAIVSTQQNHGKRKVTNADGSAVGARPLAVLVDHDSASGSELVTAAIAEHGAGTVVGARTFGKGLVQTMVPLPDGAAIKLTTARYFTPQGHDIDRVGITPAVAVDEPPDAVPGVPGRDPQLDAALALLAKQVSGQAGIRQP
ncbi:MAG: S41 family peptidase [Candidatus Velthaea sp.]